MPNPVLLGDLSGESYLKLALAAPGERPGISTHFACRSLEELDASLTAFLDTHGRPQLKGAALAACGWENDGGLSMPNHDFRVHRRWLHDRLDVMRLNLVNDCVCKGLALERLYPEEQVLICGTPGDPDLTRALIGVARGLGTVAIITDDLNRVTVLPCEGGHSDLPTATDRENDIRQVMAQKYGHVSRERVVSLPGLADVWWCLGELDGDKAREIAPQDVVDLARAGDARAQEAVRLVTSLLAATASDTALITGARGGIYLAGEMFDLLGDLLDIDLFRSRFCDKGRLTRYVEDIPVYRIQTPEPEIIGLSTLFA